MSRYELHERDLVRPVSLQVGDQLVLVLNERPMTGYRWRVDVPATSIMSPSGSSFVPVGGRLGTSGERRLRFEAVGPGTAHVQLELRRSAADGAPQRRIQVEIQVTG